VHRRRRSDSSRDIPTAARRRALRHRLAAPQEGPAGEPLRQLAQPDLLRRRGRGLVLDRPPEDASRHRRRDSRDADRVRGAIPQWAVTVSQQYQFFRNQWFHPRVGAGVELAHETTSSAFEPFSVYDPVSRTSRLVAPEIDGPDTSLITRGVGEVGFKAYVARRAFFTADMRLMFRNGIDQVLFRTGFGFDF
jgi:hypothetical protein